VGLTNRRTAPCASSYRSWHVHRYAQPCMQRDVGVLPHKSSPGPRDLNLQALAALGDGWRSGGARLVATAPLSTSMPDRATVQRSSTCYRVLHVRGRRIGQMVLHLHRRWHPVCVAALGACKEVSSPARELGPVSGITSSSWRAAVCAASAQWATPLVALVSDASLSWVCCCCPRRHPARQSAPAAARPEAGPRAYALRRRQ